jgi:hypothetical protein
MPSGKRARQQRQSAAGGKTPPAVRSKGSGGGGGPSFSLSKRTLAILGVVLLVAIGLGLFFAFSGNGSSSNNSSTGGNLAPLSTLGTLQSPPQLGAQGPEGIPAEAGPTIAPPASPLPNTSVDGITCDTGEQLAFHIHARLTLFVDGKQEKVPGGIGISSPQPEQTQRGPFVASGACFSWLHTHASDGIIHIESPVQRTFTLGNFFDVWAQPLTKTQVGPVKGPVTALVNGQVWTGNPRDIPLDAHNQIQLEVGKPLVGPEKISNWEGL